MQAITLYDSDESIEMIKGWLIPALAFETIEEMNLYKDENEKTFKITIQIEEI